MTGKTVTFGSKPKTKNVDPATQDKWVKSRNTDTGTTMKRLTIDVPETLHRKIKMDCAERGVKMADEIRALLSKHFD